MNASNVGNLGEVVPITITAPPNGDGNTTHGLGRIATIGELALVLIKVDDRKDKTALESVSNIAASVSVSGGPVTSFTPPTQTLVEWALVPKLVSPMSGYVALANNIRFHFSQINLSIGGQTTTGTFTDMHDVGRCSSGRDSVMGGLIGVEALIENGAPTDSAYPTGLLLLNGTSGSALSGGISGNVTVQVYAPDPGSNLSGVTPLQTLNFNFAMPGTSSTPIPAPIPRTRPLQHYNKPPCACPPCNHLFLVRDVSSGVYGVYDSWEWCNGHGLFRLSKQHHEELYAGEWNRIQSYRREQHRCRALTGAYRTDGQHSSIGGRLAPARHGAKSACARFRHASADDDVYAGLRRHELGKQRDARSSRRNPWCFADGCYVCGGHFACLNHRPRTWLWVGQLELIAIVGSR